MSDRQGYSFLISSCPGTLSPLHSGEVCLTTGAVRTTGLIHSHARPEDAFCGEIRNAGLELPSEPDFWS